MNSKKSPSERAERKLEAQVQAEIISYLAACGILCFVIPNRGLYDPRTGRYNRVEPGHIPGIPDLAIVLKDGKVLWTEVKRPDGGILSPAQQHLLSLLINLGHMAVVVRSVSELETYMKSRGLI